MCRVSPVNAEIDKVKYGYKATIVRTGLRIQVNSMMEIPFSEQSGAVRNAYREGAFLVLQMCASLPDVCVACGNPAAGNVVHKRFGPPDLWWVLPPLTDVIYFVEGRCPVRH